MAPWSTLAGGRCIVGDFQLNISSGACNQRSVLVCLLLLLLLLLLLFQLLLLFLHLVMPWCASHLVRVTPNCVTDTSWWYCQVKHQPKGQNLRKLKFKLYHGSRQCQTRWLHQGVGNANCEQLSWSQQPSQYQLDLTRCWHGCKQNEIRLLKLDCRSQKCLTNVHNLLETSVHCRLNSCSP